MRYILITIASIVFLGCNNPTQDYNPVQGKIAFVSNRDGNYELYSMDLDGNNQKRLTNNENSDFAPRWSPDGQSLVFNSDLDGSFDIYTMHADGSELAKVFESDSSEWDPEWAPDGNSVVFGSNIDGDMEIYILNLETKGLLQLTNNDFDDYNPAIAPNGDRIAFLSNRYSENPQNNEVILMNMDGSGIQRLTENNNRETIMSWSPDDNYLIFTLHPCPGWSNCESPDDEIVTLNLSDLTLTNISNSNLTSEEHPYWSNNIDFIVFDSNRDGGDLQIYTANSNGENPTRISQDTSYMDFWSSIYIY